MFILSRQVIKPIQFLVLLIAVYFNFQSHAVWLANNTPEISAPPFCIDLLTRIQFSDNEKEIINTFHESGEGARFFDPHLGLRYEHPLKKRGERISYLDQVLTIFLKLDQSLSGNYYVAMMGPSIFTVKKLNNQLFEQQGIENFDYQLRLNQNLPNLLNKFDIKTSLYYSDFTSAAGQTYVLKEYTPGPTIDELDDLFLKGKISREKWIHAHQTHVEFMKKISSLSVNQEYIAHALELNLSPNLDMQKIKTVYFNGQWVIDQF